MESIDAFIESTLAQSNTATAISAGTLGLITLVWASHFRIKDDLRIKGFRWVLFLVIPFGLALISLISGYSLNAATTGYRFELVTGIDQSAPQTSNAILDPKRFFLDGYVTFFAVVGFWQLLSGVAAVILTWSWFAVNIISKFGRRAKRIGKGEAKS